MAWYLIIVFSTSFKYGMKGANVVPVKTEKACEALKKTLEKEKIFSKCLSEKKLAEGEE